VVYGLVHPVESYNPFYLQFHHFAVILRNMYNFKGWNNKISVLFKGPGWSPGKPRLGYVDEIPEVSWNYAKSYTKE
jgi:alkylglycerol monooxygenase